MRYGKTSGVVVVLAVLALVPTTARVGAEGKGGQCTREFREGRRS